MHRIGFNPNVRKVQRWHPEGSSGYGCWFIPLLPPHDKGSGIFVNTGRVLTFTDRVEAGRWCDSSPVPPDLKWAAKANAEGFDSVLIMDGVGGNPELIVTTPLCLNQSRPIGSCLPQGIEVRTGWSAHLPCVCVEYDQAGIPTKDVRRLVGGVINCDGTPLHRVREVTSGH